MSCSMSWDLEDIQDQPVVMSNHKSCEDVNCDGYHSDESSNDELDDGRDANTQIEQETGVSKRTLRIWRSRL